MIWWAVFIAGLIALPVVFLAYAACVVGGRADDDMEQWYDARTK